MSKLAAGLVCFAMSGLLLLDWALTRIVLRHERWILELRRRGPEEQRCEFCQDTDCPARNSGVTFPCEYFVKEEHYGKSDKHQDP